MNGTGGTGGMRPVVVRSTTDEVAERLREAILSGLIDPGEHLPERELASDLGVSNIALREAFSRLAEEGLVVRVPRRGAFASPISPEFIRDLGEIRVLLEQHAVRRTMRRWSPAADAEVEAIVQRMEAAAERLDADELFRLDQEFHGSFLHQSGSALLVELGSNLRGRIGRSIREAMVRHPESLPQLPPLHRRWLDAVRSGDEERAVAEVAAHITGSTDSIAEALEAVSEITDETVDSPKARRTLERSVVDEMTRDQHAQRPSNG